VKVVGLGPAVRDTSDDRDVVAVGAAAGDDCSDELPPAQDALRMVAARSNP
jgi:hypothetical protein